MSFCALNFYWWSRVGSCSASLSLANKTGCTKKNIRKTETNFASKHKLKRFEENLVKSWSAKNSTILKHGLDPNQVPKYVNLKEMSQNKWSINHFYMILDL